MEDIFKSLDQKLKPLLESLRQEFSGIRVNRPSPRLVEDIPVDYLGQSLKIKQLGSISVLLPRGLAVTVWDKESAGAVAKAIENSSLKLNPSVDGNVIRINLPDLTAERREELTKMVKKSAESIKIRIRSLRDEINKEVERSFKEKKIDEDKKFKTKDKIQEAVDKANEEIENLLESKIKEISD